MSKYLLEIVAIIDVLANIEDFILDEDPAIYTLGELGDDYEQLI